MLEQQIFGVGDSPVYWLNKQYRREIWAIQVSERS